MDECEEDFRASVSNSGLIEENNFEYLSSSKSDETLINIFENFNIRNEKCTKLNTTKAIQSK